MTAQAAHQLWLPFGAAEQFEMLHGRHNCDVWLCDRGVTGDDWRQNAYPHDDARQFALNWEGEAKPDCYQSQAGFRGPRRTIENTQALTCNFVDLDTYNVGAAGLTPYALLSRMAELAPHLPPPTTLTFSGRGWYAHWIFPVPEGPPRLTEWNLVQKHLVQVFKPLGADSSTSAAHVLRIPGTTNSKSGERVVGLRHQIGYMVPLKALLGSVRRAMDAVPQPSPQPKTRRPSTSALTAGSLALARMDDCATLARLRGSPRLADGRSRLLYAYAMSGAFFWGCREQARDELEAFAAEHFIGGRRYHPGRVVTVLDRADDARSGVQAIFQGRRVDRRYTPSNRYLISLLQITPDEQRHLKTIICSEEKGRRLTEKRRASGVQERGAYLKKERQKTSEQRQKAIELRGKGLSGAGIAAALGLTRARVSQLLKTPC